MDFSVPVGKREASGTVMVIGWHISPSIHSIHKREVVTIINGIRMFIEKDILLRWGDDRRELTKGEVGFINLSRVPAVPIHASVHRDTSDPRVALRADLTSTPVGRALIQAQ